MSIPDQFGKQGEEPGFDAASGTAPRAAYGAADYNPASYPGGGYPGGPGAVAPLPGSPNPGLAALLGFIPGVGAMYNGQFAKGIAHIAIFAVLSSLSKNVNGIFGLFVAGWVFYMVFEAYQTARARRDGFPLPDPFGLNNVGERFGFQHGPNWSDLWGQNQQRPGPVADGVHVDAQTGGVYGTRTDAGNVQTAYHVDPAGNVYTSAGYPGSTPPTAGYPSAYPGYETPPGYVPPAYAVPPVPPMPPMPPAVRGSGLPTGALVLIGLGIFALLGSLHPFAFLEGEATGGLFLMALGLFLFYRRWAATRALFAAGSPSAGWNLLRCLKAGGIVFVVGLLTLLQGLHVLYWESSWPILLICLGVFILLERLALNKANPVPAPYGQPFESQVPPSTTPNTPAESLSVTPRTGFNDIDQEGR